MASSGGDGLRAKVVSGVSWNLGSQLVVQGSRIAVAVILARLLTPHEFGVAAMALVFSGLAIVFTDLSLGAALIQRPRITELDRSTVFWTTSCVGALTTIVAIASATTVAAFFHEPAVADLFLVVSITFTLTALSATQAAILTREMAFRSLQIREMTATTVGSSAAVLAAFAGFGPWALIAQALAASTVSLILLWSLSRWRPRFTYSLASLRELGSFGAKMFVSRLLGYANQNADNLLIGRFLGSAALGIYALAYNAMLAPTARLTAPVQQVLFPAFSRLQGDTGRLGQAWLRGTRIGTGVTVAAFAGMIAIAPDLVPVVFGESWKPAVPVLQCLCLAGIAQGFHSFNWSLLQARGRAGTLLRFMLFSSALNVTAFAIGLRWGVVGVAACYAASRTVQMPLYVWLACRAAEVRIRDFVRMVSGVVQASLAMFLVVVGVRELLIGAGASASARLAALVPIGVVVFSAFVLLRERDLLAEVRRLRGGDVAEAKGA